MFTYKVTKPGIPLLLGRQGENLARSMAFDISGWVSEFGDGTAVLLVKRPEDSSAYPASVSLEDGTVTWAVTSTDTAQAGKGKCELQYLVGDVVVKSRTWQTVVTASLEAAGDVPDPETGWVAELIAKVREIVDEAAVDDETLAAAIEAYMAEHEITAESLGALTEDDLADAITAALAEAKESGEFDGADGVGISKMEQTTGSTESGAANVWTATMSNGESYDFAVYNGINGIGAAIFRTTQSLAKDSTTAVLGNILLAYGSDLYETTLKMALYIFNNSGTALLLDSNDNLFLLANTLVDSSTAGVTYLTNIKGATGAQGDKGDTGDTGEQGEKGDTGADGASAYEVAVANGYTGTEAEWLESLKGADGASVSRVEMTADDTEATLSPNTLYVFPEMSALAITLADPEDTGIVNEYHFIFTSGETATELSIPDTINVGSLSIAASTTYEISIVEGLLAYQSWEVG